MEGSVWGRGRAGGWGGVELRRRTFGYAMHVKAVLFNSFSIIIPS